MKSDEYKIEWLSMPEVFEVNRLDPVSDHLYVINGWKPVQSLNGNWFYTYSDTAEGRDENFYQLDVDYTDKPVIQVPGHIQLQGLGQIQYTNKIYPWDGKENLKYGQIPEHFNPTISYVKYFDLDPRLEGMDIHLTFHGVESAFYVWLNGVFVGYGEDSFTPSTFDITDVVKEKGNKLAVQVHQYSSASWLEDQDFFRFSGIFRDVELVGIPSYHIEDLKILTTLSNEYRNARILIDFVCSKEDANYSVRLIDPQGFLILEFDTQKNYLAIDLKDVHLWSAEHPNLYTLQIDVKDPEGVVNETVIQRIGIREFKMEEGVMKLNGKRIVFKGINRHEFNPCRGRAITREDMLADIRFMKQNNINAVRTSHYPNQSLWYELCDVYGLYVIDETNLETHGTWNPLDKNDYSNPLPGNDRRWRGAVLDRANNMYQRDKNHPSILLWSLGNECAAGDVLLEEAAFFKREDPDRLVHYESSWNQPDYQDCTDVYSRMYPKAAEVEEYLKSNPDKPIILCEYSHAMGNSLGGMDEYTKLESYEQYQGGFIWDFMDQALYYDADGRKVLGYGGDFDDHPNDGNFSGNGILFANRKPSPKADEMKYLYQNIKIEPERHGVKITNDSLFTNTSEFEFRYALYNEDECIQQGILETNVAPSETRKYFINWNKSDAELTRIVSAHLKEPALWADAGHEVAFGQSVTGEYPHLMADGGNLEIFEGSGNVGFSNDHFFVMFGPQGMSSLKYNGQEYLAGIPKPVFAHASTDNEKGFGFDASSSMWYAASMFAKVHHVSRNLNPASHMGVVQYDYVLPTNPVTSCSVTYSVASPGLIGVDISLRGKPDLPDLPMFGLQIPLKKTLDTFIYYGRGPHENYPDRKQGSKMGVYTQSVKENVTPYLKPQEMGSRSDVRWAEVISKPGKGVCLSMVKDPFNISVLPYSFDQLESASHIEELPAPSKTYATIAKDIMGVGGDDSWGAPVLEKYRLDASKDRIFSFILSQAFKMPKEETGDVIIAEEEACEH